MGPKNGLPSLRYFGLPPAQPLRLAFVDPTDRYLRAWKPVRSCLQFDHILCQIAMDIFSIPAMSSECGRVFSQLRRLITFERTRLGDTTIESDECQKHWLASGCLKLKDTDDEDDSEPMSMDAEFCIYISQPVSSTPLPHQSDQMKTRYLTWTWLILCMCRMFDLGVTAGPLGILMTSKFR